jgi:hypothetical protein
MIAIFAVGAAILCTPQINVIWTCLEKDLQGALEEGRKLSRKMFTTSVRGFMQTLMFRVNENQDWHGVILAC